LSAQVLQDQIGSFVQHECIEPITYYKYTNQLRAAGAVAEWLLLGRGPMTLFPMASSAMLRSCSAASRPDLQFYMFPVAVNPHSEGTFEPCSHAYNIHWGIIHPKSRGSVRLGSNMPCDNPVIRHNYFSIEEDRILNRSALRIARDIHAQQSFTLYRGAEVAPGPACQTDAEIDDHTSRYFANHYHASGTCSMGVGEDAVVDPQLRVRGIARLRVIDSSIMPIVVSGGLNAASMMIGEKGSQMLLTAWQ
jgi:choline dehydrogenase